MITEFSTVDASGELDAPRAWMFVVMPPNPELHGSKAEKKLYACRKLRSSTVGSWHHNSLTNGAPCACAGMLVIERGVLKEILFESGHYYPKWIDALRMLRWLRYDKRVDLTDVKVSYLNLSYS